MDKANLQRNNAAGRMHISNIEKNSMKVFHKRVTWKMLVTAAQYVHYQCCTSCLRQLYMQDLLHPLTNVNNQTRGGFRPNHRTVDHMMEHTMMAQRSRAWGIPLYISTIDFIKSFDKIKHQDLWTALEHYGIWKNFIHPPLEEFEKTKRRS